MGFLRKRKSNLCSLLIKRTVSNIKPSSVIKDKTEGVNDLKKKYKHNTINNNINNDNGSKKDQTKAKVKVKDMDKEKEEDFDKTWKYIIRNNYINKIENAFKKKKTEDILRNENGCYFVLGAEGVGKRFFIEKAKERFLSKNIKDSNNSNTNYSTFYNGNEKKHIFLEYNFKGSYGDSFKIKLYKFDVFLRSYLLRVLEKDIKKGKIRLDVFFYYLKKKDANFDINLQSFFKHALSNNSHFNFIGEKEKSEIERYVKQLDMNQFGFKEWQQFINILLQKLNVKCFCNSFNELSAAFYFLRILTEYKEQVDFCKKSKIMLANYSNGLYIYMYFFLILQFLESQLSYQFYFIFYNFHLALACEQPEKSFFFFQKMIHDNMKLYHMPIVIHSLKNIEMMKFLFVYDNMVVGNCEKELEKGKPQNELERQIELEKMKQTNKGKELKKMDKDINTKTNEHENKNTGTNGRNNIDRNTRYNTTKSYCDVSSLESDMEKKVIENYDSTKQENTRDFHKKDCHNKNSNAATAAAATAAATTAATTTATAAADNNNNSTSTSSRLFQYEDYELVKNNLIEINDFSYEMIKCIFIPQYTKNEKIAQYIYNTIGGNIQLIKTICKGLHELNKENSDIKIMKDIEKEKNEKHTYDIDEEDINNSRSLEEIVKYRKYEKEKMFLKEMAETILCKFILDFEHKIISFFSLSEIEKMKLGDKRNNKEALNFVEFHFTVFEVIKYFLKKKKVFCKSIINLNNPILLGLIDVNIIHYNYENKYLELTNQFYEVLLKNYIDFKYKQFPLKLRAQYNIQHVLNYNVIAHEYKLLETQ